MRPRSLAVEFTGSHSCWRNEMEGAGDGNTRRFPFFPVQVLQEFTVQTGTVNLKSSGTLMTHFGSGGTVDVYITELFT